MGDRSRGALLYATAGVVLLAGAGWYVWAAPDTGEDPRVAAWTATVERLVPDQPLQAMADTVVLSGATSRESTTPVDGGSYTLTMACAGSGQVRVRLSSFGDDSGRAVRCTEEPSSEQINVGLADEFFMVVSSEPQGPGRAVFRWRLDRNRGY